MTISACSTMARAAKSFAAGLAVVAMMTVGLMSSTTGIPAAAATTDQLNIPNTVAYLPLNSTTKNQDIVGKVALDGSDVAYQDDYVDLSSGSGYLASNTWNGAKTTGDKVSFSFDYAIPEGTTGSSNSTLFTYGTDATKTNLSVHPFYESGKSAVVIRENGSKTLELPFNEPALGQWHNMTVSLDGSTNGQLSVWVDGVSEGRVASKGITAQNIGNGALRLNRESWGYTNLSSYYRDVRVINGGLTADNVKSLANANAHAKLPSGDAITVDADDIKKDNVNGLTFKGFGMLSGNSTSALLLDYKAEHSEAYNQLMKILFGGSNPVVSNLKVEMGNDENNSTGPDPSTMRTSTEDANPKREPGFQLAADAKQYNPNLKVSILRWKSPAWVKSNDDVYRWFKNTILAVYRDYGYMVDYVNPGYNERKADLNWSKDFAQRIKDDSTGYENGNGNSMNGWKSQGEEDAFHKIKTVISDESGIGSFGNDMTSSCAADKGTTSNSDTLSLCQAISVAGYHYNTNDDGSGNFTKLADTYDKEVWNSEAQATFSNTLYRPNNNTKDPTVAGTGIGGTGSALEMANTIVKGFVNSRRTNFIYQPLVGSFYEGAQYSFKELVSARDPWSGWMHYDGGLDVLRQFTDFAKTGWENDKNDAGIWRAIPEASKTTASGANPVDGRNGKPDYITLGAPDKSNFSTVVVNDSEYTRTYVVTPRHFAFNDGSNSKKLGVWETRASDSGQKLDANYLQHVGDLTADKDGAYTVTIKPYSIATVTSLTEPLNSADKDGIQPLPEDGDRTVLDERKSQNDTALYSDDFEYSGMKVKRIGEGGKLSNETDDFIDSRGGNTGATPLYTSDLNGAFEVYASKDAKSGDHVLRQQIDKDATGVGEAWNSGDPMTAIGDYRWTNYKADVNVRFERDGTQSGGNYAFVGARYLEGSQKLNGAAYGLKFMQDGSWSLTRLGTVVQSGKVAAGNGDVKSQGSKTPASGWHNIAIQVAGSMATAFIDGVQVGSYNDSDPILSGRMELGSGYYNTDFDDLRVQTVNGYTPYYPTSLDDQEMTAQNGVDKELTYDGSWSHVNGQGMYTYQRSLSSSNGAGASLSYTFTGTGLDIQGKNDGTAKLSVIVDGQTLQTGAGTWKSGDMDTTFSLRGLPYGKHTVKLALDSGTLNIDLVGVVGATVESAPDVSALRTLYQKVKDLQRGPSVTDDAAWMTFQANLAIAKSVLTDASGTRLETQGVTQDVSRLQAAATAVSDPVKVDDVSTTTWVNENPQLPGTVTGKDSSGKTVKLSAQWNLDSVQFSSVWSTITVSGVAAGIYPVTANVTVLPRNLVYFIDSGVTAGQTSPIFTTVSSVASGLNNTVADQPKSDGAGNTWGYVSKGVSVKSGTDVNDMYSTGLWQQNDTLQYQFQLKPGTYSLTAGFNEWWGSTRPMSEKIDWSDVKGIHSVSGTDVNLSSSTPKATGAIDKFTVSSPTTATYSVTKTGSSNPVISWVAIQQSDAKSSIGGVSIESETSEVEPGDSLQFASVVSGKGDFSKAVKWSVSGATSKGTTISPNGLLSVGSDEQSDTLSVKAASVQDPARSASAKITVRIPTAKLMLSSNTVHPGDRVTGTLGQGYSGRKVAMYLVPDGSGPNGDKLGDYTLDANGAAVLAIPSSTSEGKYFVVVRNGAGVQIAKAQLTVKAGKPGPNNGGGNSDGGKGGDQPDSGGQSSGKLARSGSYVPRILTMVIGIAGISGLLMALAITLHKRHSSSV